MVLLASRRTFVPLHVGRFSLLALGGLLIGHEAVYLAQYGEGAALSQAMTAGGHDGYWTALTTIALSGLLLLLLRSAWRLAELRGAATAGPTIQPLMGQRTRPYEQELLRLWPPLFGTVAVAYVIQENIEHLVAQGHLAGFSPLVGVQAPLALPILGVVTLAFAVVGALVRWRIAVLEAQARAAHAAIRWFAGGDALESSWALIGAIRATFWSLARQGPVRAPPPTFA